MKKSEVTERMKELMTDSDRSALFAGSFGEVQPLSAPAADECTNSKYDYDLEKKEHVIFENWLNQHELGYDHQRMDRRTSNRCGMPDFIVGVEAQLVAIEFKRPGKCLSPAQLEWQRRFSVKSKCRYHVCRTADFAISCIKYLMPAA